MNLCFISYQDPQRASDKALTSCGSYKMKEDDAMVYRRPYLISGSSGFALNAIIRSMKNELKVKIFFLIVLNFLLIMLFSFLLQTSTSIITSALTK